MQTPSDIDAILIDALEQASEAFVIYDENLELVLCNRTFRDMYGYSDDQAKSGTPMQVLIELDVRNGNVPVGFEKYGVQQYLQLRSNTPHAFEYQLSDGRWISINERSTSSGGIVSVQRDVTHRKNNEEALLKQKALFQTAFNADHNACSITVLETGEFIDVNDAWCRVRGWQREGVIGKTALELNVWGDPSKRAEILKEVQKQKSKGRYETTVNSPINGMRNLVLSWSIIFVNDTECLFLSTMDITERKKIEKAKEESERLFKTIFEKAPIGLALYQNDTGRLVIANQEYREIVGISGEEEFIDWRDITHPNDLQQDEQNYKKLVEGEIDGYSMEKRYIHADGQMKRAELTVVGIGSEQDEFSQQHLAMLADITDRYELEERLQQSQKMEAVGQLTGGIAHDFNNLLAVIQGNTELVREMVVAKQDIRVSQIDSILRAAERGAELTHNMLAFSRKQALNPVTIKLDLQVKTTIDILRRTLGETISIRTLFAQDLWPCRADPGKVENVLLNLGINARDAMPRGGDLIIEVYNAILAADEILGSSQAKPGKYVALSVKDTGTGISAEHLEHVFEPFFTTKEPGKGTGLGLSMVYGFAEQSDGYLTISSEQDKGTTVILYLPFADPEAT